MPWRRCPLDPKQLIDAFGPHLNWEPPGGFAARGTPDRMVKEALLLLRRPVWVKLQVKDGRVDGVEPRD